MTEFIYKRERIADGIYSAESTGEEIVRCRDCVHYYEGWCMLTDGMGDFKRWLVDDDDYCSDGEVVGA